MRTHSWSVLSKSKEVPLMFGGFQLWYQVEAHYSECWEVGNFMSRNTWEVDSWKEEGRRNVLYLGQAELSIWSMIKMLELSDLQKRRFLWTTRLLLTTEESLWYDPEMTKYYVSMNEKILNAVLNQMGMDRYCWVDMVFEDGIGILAQR